jgi:tetratricopeptide (TPR) repeat protein
MSLEEFSQLLIAADESERRRLLAENEKFADARLAFALKEIAYEAWTVEPKKAQDAAAALETLAAINRDRRIFAVKIWINGIAALTRGENEAAIKFLDEAAQIWAEINETQLAAQTQVAKLYPLAVVGRYEDAIENGKAALAVFERDGDELAAGKIEKNLGSLLGRRGRYDDSASYFLSAQKRFLALENQAELAMVENNLALIKSFQNDFRAAEKLYEDALQRARLAGLNATEAEIFASLGNLALFRGRYDEALRALEKSRQKYAALEMPAPAAVIDLEIAEVYVELNLFEEAKEILARVAEQFCRLKMRAEEARARTQLGRALSERATKTDAAFAELERAEKLYEAEDNRIGSATVKLIKTILHLSAKRFAAAEILSSEAAGIFEQGKSWRLFLFAEFFRGETARCQKDWARAERIFSNALEISREKEQPQIAWLFENALGKIVAESGDERRAETHFRRAINLIEDLRSPLAGDEFRTAFFADKLAPFHRLAALCRKNPSRLAESLVCIERARSQALLDLLGDRFATTERISVADNENQVTELQRLHEELNWYYSRLNRPTRAASAQAAHDEIENWQKEIRKLEREINALVLHLEAAGERATEHQRDLDLPRLQILLGKNRILLEFAELDGEFAAYVVTDDEIRLVEHLGKPAEIGQILEKIHFQFGALRYGAPAVAKHLPVLKMRTERHLQVLHEILWQPLAAIVGDKHPIIVPAGALNYVPFQALHDGKSYLIERREISYAPSAGVLQTLLEKKSKKVKKVLALGFADERVPQVENEIFNLQKVMPEARAFVGEAATVATLKENLKENFDALHLACHGQFRAENPLFSSLHLADGWLTVREAAKLRLADSLVVLSACETGLSEIAAGDELLGLVRGFLAAGSSSLVLTLWTVNDAAASTLMTEFYKNLQAADSFATALRRAQLHLIKQNLHPYFWSPFSLVGRW